MSEKSKTVGVALHAARTSAGFSLQEISDITRIRKDVLKDLEADNFVSSGGMAYARGHIRSIAKTIGADSDALIVLFEETTGEVERPMIDLLTENNATTPRRQLPKVSYKAMSGIAAGIVGLIFLGSVASSYISPAAPSASKKEPTSTATSSNEPVTTVATKTTGVTVVVTGTNGKSWIGVTDSAGAQVFSGQITTGESKTFTDDLLVQLVVGNAGAVSLNVNGKELGTPGKIGEVAHLQFDPNSSNQG